MESFDTPGLVDSLRARLIGLGLALRSPTFVGKYQLKCPVCGHKGLFKWFGNPPRRDARCPGCGSLERHRLLKLWFDANLDRLRGGRALHFAPEPSIVKMFKPAAGAYVTADIVEGRADKTLNIENMSGEAAGSYDWILCSHVLEHVDDSKALAEMHRILKPGGLLIVMIPIVEGWPDSYENPEVTSRADRERFFGQNDHVRYYGEDVRRRITAAGFALDEFTATEPMVSRYGLVRGEKVFLATKAA
jgi:SAM-dependent methyltransferase